MAAVPSIGRASAVEPRSSRPEADVTRDLYERYHRQIFSYCLHQLSNREEAEDATQTTFMNAFRGLQRGVVPELESAWLFKIANNVILTRRRSSYRRRRVESPGDLDAIQDLLPSPQRDADELIRLTEALGGMPEQQRKALLLREWQGLSYREIGDELDLSQAAVETLLFRARRSLAAGLTEAPKDTATPRKKHAARLRSGLDIGSAVAGIKALLTGGAAVKVAVTAAAVATTAVVAEHPARHHLKPEPLPPKVEQLATPVASRQRAPVAAASPSTGRTTVRLEPPARPSSQRPAATPYAAHAAPKAADAGKTDVTHAVPVHAAPAVAPAAPAPEPPAAEQPEAPPPPQPQPQPATEPTPPVTPLPPAPPTLPTPPAKPMLPPAASTRVVAPAPPTPPAAPAAALHSGPPAGVPGNGNGRAKGEDRGRGHGWKSDPAAVPAAPAVPTPPTAPVTVPQPPPPVVQAPPAPAQPTVPAVPTPPVQPVAPAVDALPAPAAEDARGGWGNGNGHGWGRGGRH